MTAPVLHVAGRVLVGPDDIRDEMWVVDGRVTFTRPQDGTPDSVQGFVLPGLVDAHCHLGMDPQGVAAERIEEHALTNRDAGALLLRDAGSPVDDRWVQDREDLPRLVRAARHIARPQRYIRGVAHEVEPEKLVEQVRHEARAGDGWVKLVGDWIDRERGDLAPLWPRDVATEAIAAAHEEGARVTAHCFGEESLADLAAAGIDCVEHACGLLPETIEAFAAQRIAIVPTLVNIAGFPKHADAGEAKFPDYARHMRDLHVRRHTTIAQAHEAGIPIYVGTDAGGQLPHGLAAKEIAELTRAGMSNAEAISAGTWAARAWLGFTGLEEGAEADFAVFDTDPLEDIGALEHPRHIVLRGRLVR